MPKYLKEFQQQRKYKVALTLFLIDLIFLILHVVHVLTQYFAKSLFSTGMDGEYAVFYQSFSFELLHKLTTYLANPLFSIELDNGYAETYQHLKFFGIVIAFCCLCIQKKSWSFAPWVLLFTYFLLDDSLQLHERLGSVIASEISFVPPFGLRRQQLG
jgi:hypothetical protein